MGESLMIACPRCGAKNRVDRARMADAGKRPVCGKCRAPLGSGGGSGKPVDVTDATFGDTVSRSPVPVLVDCWAPWCGPCRMVAPVLDEIAAAYKGRVTVAKLNVDQNPGVAGRFGVSSIPTLLVFKGGQEVDRMVGALPRREIESRLQRFL